MTDRKVCPACGKYKRWAEFYKRKDAKSTHRTHCKLCFLQRGAEYTKNYRKTVVGYLKLTYHNIVHRCNSPVNRAYKYYGGRGIKCLFASAEEFVDYVIDVLQVDPRGLECDRIENNGNYEPGNIRFVTHAVNMNNGRVDKHGEKHHASKLSDWDRRLVFGVYHDGAYTQQELADHFGVRQVTISHIVNTDRWV